MRLLLFLVSLGWAAVLTAQTVAVNLGMEQGEVGQIPPGWLVPQVLLDRGDRAELRREGCYAGTGCAVILRPDNPAANSPGNLMQRIDATPYRGKRVLLRAAIRVEPLDAEGRCQLWFRVDLAGGGRGFLVDMRDRPIRSAEWQTYEISGDVDPRASFISFGAQAFGRARVWLDAVSIEAATPITEGPEVAAAREAIGKLYALLDSAYERGQPEVLVSLALPDAQVGSALQKMPITAAIEEWKRLIASGAKISAKSEITSLSLSGSEATVGVRQLMTITRNGAAQTVEGMSTDKWVRQDTGWKLRESLVTSGAERVPPTDPETAKRVAAELRQRVVPLTTAEPGKPYQDLAALGKAVGDARVVALGEATHGTREIFQMKHRLLEYLVKEKGFTVFAIEANWPESIAVDRYIKTGEGDPRKALAGMYFWTWQTEEVLAMVEWMRTYNQTAGARSLVSFTSFDMQTYPVALERVVDYTRKHAASELPSVETSYKVLRELAASSQRNDPRMTAASAQAESVVKLLKSRRKALAQASGETAFREALQAARIVVQASRLRSPGVSADYRDQMMAANVAWLAKEAFPGEKIVLWAHNGHVKAARTPLSRPMGDWLREGLGGGLYVLGFAIHKGDARAVAFQNGRTSGLNTSPVPPAPAGTGTAVLGAVGLPIFFADLRSLAAGGGALGAWLGQPHLFREFGAMWNRDDPVNGNMVSEALGRAYDGLVFLEDTHAARGLP